MKSKSQTINRQIPKKISSDPLLISDSDSNANLSSESIDEVSQLSGDSYNSYSDDCTDSASDSSWNYAE